MNNDMIISVVISLASLLTAIYSYHITRKYLCIYRKLNTKYWDTIKLIYKASAILEQLPDNNSDNSANELSEAKKCLENILKNL